MATLERPCRDLRGSAGGPTLDHAKSEPYSNDNCDRLLALTCKSIFGDFLQLFPELRLLLGKVNDRTLPGYKRLPSGRV